MANYFPYHVHTDLSNCTTNIDSVTKFHQYVEHAKELGMKALAFTEHGNIFEWYHKKLAVEEAGMKYVHGVEAYLTMHEQEKFKDNYHIVLLARNKEGFMEINRLVSSSFNRNDDIHYYYTPRILMSELERTSQNILITTACLGGPLNADSDEDRERFTRFMLKNKERCFLEIQHHLVAEQMMYNQSLLELSVRYGIPLIAGTDTHALTEAHLRGRKKLQEGKGIHFPQEENWSLQFMTYDELCAQYKTQNAIPEKYWREALENTNRLADMCEAFEVDSSIKYPNVIDDPVEALRNVVYEYAENHPHAIKRHGKEALYERLDMELDAFKQTGQSGYMYLLNHLCKWERENGERIGYGRGSVAGSMAAYVMGATHMDSMLHNLNFSRFCNVSRVSLADVDIDHSETDRDKTKRFLLDDHMGFDHLNTAEIVTFNTIATKGAIRDIARSFSMPLSEVSEICNSVDRDDKVPENIRTKYAELFEYVDIVSGTVVSYGSHPCGVLVSDHDIESEIGLCSSSGSNYRISCLNMKELDALNYVKWDVLGLDGIDLINTCCDLAGIERITPDNIDLEDMDVWKSIRDNNTCIFQFESDQAGSYLRRLMSDANIERMKKADPTFSMLKLFTFASALLRPACASFRDDVAEGKTYDNGCAEINDMLAGERGYVAYQERIMQFLSRFAGYSDSESDTVRRAIAKKKGTETLLPEIERRFMDYAPKHLSITEEQAAIVIKDFLQVILDASSYGFSENHSMPYAITGYAIGYLRHYYPVHFVAAALNVYASNSEKIAAIMEYAQEHGIRVSPPRFGLSKAHTNIDTENLAIYKGLYSVKYMNEEVPNQLYEIAQTIGENSTFMDLLTRIKAETSCDSRQLDILIKLDFFSAYGNSTELIAMNWYHDLLDGGKKRSIKKEKIFMTPLPDFIADYGTDCGRNGRELKQWNITDCPGLLNRCYRFVKDSNMREPTYEQKCKWQQEFLGYVDLTTGKIEDRKKLFITDMRPLRAKKDNSVWAYAVFTRSVGTGKCGRFTLRNWNYQLNPIKKEDIIQVLDYHNERGYWYLDEYEIVV